MHTDVTTICYLYLPLALSISGIDKYFVDSLRISVSVRLQKTPHHKSIIFTRSRDKTIRPNLIKKTTTAPFYFRVPFCIVQRSEFLFVLILFFYCQSKGLYRFVFIQLPPASSSESLNL